jgi:Tol biopolymer transport system component/imidazolonepropionase-like amidohydrolase
MRNIITLIGFVFIVLFRMNASDYYPSGEDWKIDGAQWDHWPTDLITFETDEATWINLDLSPDGRWIVFDLLGNIYRIPFEGGTAELLSGGVAFDQQPRFSPDGSKIAFTSDRSGADNIWIMDDDGTNPKQITRETERLPGSPYWTPDGEYLVMKKHFRHIRSLGGGEIWMHHHRGGDGVRLVERLTWQADQNEPAVSPDGRWVYYSFFTGNFDYNRDPHQGIYQINRYDRESGRLEPVTRDPGGAVRPVPSPDGRKLAFVRRVGTMTVLFVRDLTTGSERAVYDGLDPDQQETWAIMGVYPAYAWTPDNREIVISFGGKINKIDVASGEVRNIPFTAQVEQKIADAVRYEYRIPDDQFLSRMIRWPSLTPDARTLVFQAGGHIYKMTLPDGRPQRISNQNDYLEYAPAVSPDGVWVAYTTWNDNEGGGHLFKMRLDGRGNPVRLTRVPDQYANPSWSPDGKHIAFLQGSGIVHRGNNLSAEFFLNIRSIPADGGETKHITETANRGANRRMPRITWHADGSRVYFHENFEDNTHLTSVKLDGTDKKRHMKNEYAEEVILSPDGRWVAFKELHNVYVAPFPKTGSEPLEINRTDSGVPVRQLTRYGGDWVSWTPDSRNVTFNLGNVFYRQNVERAYINDNEGGEDDEEARKPWMESNVLHGPEIIEIRLNIPRYRPEGSAAFTNARIITMNGDEVIENGTVVVERDRIVRVGPTDEVTIPRGVRIFDISGKTIIPGLIDAHAHAGYTALDITPDRLWEYEAQLAFGVTTTMDPSASTQMVYALSEQVEAGRMIGPRLYSTGYILYGAENPNKAVIQSLDDARAHLRRHKAQGGFSVKSYNYLRRDIRQWVLQAAREEEMLVYPEGGSFIQQNLNQIIDGHTGIEHALPVAPLYNDVITLFGRSHVGYTPTLVVGYGGVWGENYWYQMHDVYKNERLRQFVPGGWLDARARRRMLVPEDEFHHFRIAEGAKQILDAGGQIQLGAHGQLQGLAAHWELWMFVQGGMTEMEALRAATLHGARYIGHAADLGSLEPGKLDDFVILNANPLDNIKNSEDIYMVVKNGQVWDADLNELHPNRRERKPYRFTQ